MKAWTTWKTFSLQCNRAIQQKC